MKIYFVSLLFLFFKVVCNEPEVERQSSERISDFELFTNQGLSDSELKLKVDLTNAYTVGIILPNQTSTEKYFQFSFKLSNNEGSTKPFYYKLYYQNKTYKHIEVKGDGEYNLAAADNFYGSWEEVSQGFKPIGEVKDGEEIILKDSFRIVGNPRDERKFYGTKVADRRVSKESINAKINDIKNNPAWVESIVQKSEKNKINLEEQLYIDALWVLDNEHAATKVELDRQDSLLKALKSQVLETPEWKQSITEKAKVNGVSFESQLNEDVNWSFKEKYGNNFYVNNRKKRNPRMGEYEFMLVIVDDAELNKLPKSVVNLNELEQNYNSFLNPFYYFIHAFKGNTGAVVKGAQNLVVSATFKGEKGVYVNPLAIRDINSSQDYYTNLVGSTEKLYKEAQFEQYFHVINKDYTLKNVPIATNVVEAPYSRKEYEKNATHTPDSKRLNAYTKITDSPGKTVFYDSSSKAVKIINPGNALPSKWAKENVGVKTRVGFSYGKYTGKIKFAKTMNKDNIWNGITSAFWLFSEEIKPWNERNECFKEGYLPKAEKKPSTKKRPRIEYSEIDIEIVKTSKYWPKTSYGGIDDYPTDDPAENNNLIITCTNWDMTCQDPEDFNQGVNNVKYEGKTFGLHRWDYWYHALTSKFEYPHDKTVGTDLYYQIDWRPNEIIWRIGPSKNEMEIVGYMSSDNTKIPNNQMIAIVTQEFHYSDWWPLSPYKQDNIPFPSEDIEGLVYEITVE